MLEDSYRSDLREMEFTIFDLIPRSVRIGICETIVPIPALKSRVSGGLAILNASEKVLKGGVYTTQDVLKDVSVHTLIIYIFHPRGLIVI